MIGAPSLLRFTSGWVCLHAQAMLPVKWTACLLYLMHPRSPLPSCQAGVSALACSLQGIWKGAASEYARVKWLQV